MLTEFSKIVLPCKERCSIYHNVHDIYILCTIDVLKTQPTDRQHPLEYTPDAVLSSGAVPTQ